MRRAALALLWLALGGAAPVRLPRLVSINPCVDAVLVRVADPGQIAAISHYSLDARATSMPLGVARRFAATSGTAEEVVALHPDLVLTGPHVAPSTVQALKRMNIRIEEYGVPADVADSVAQVRAIAAVAGHAARGEALARMIGAATVPARVVPVGALILSGGGLVPGAGTLADDLLARAGFRNLSAAYGLKQWDVLPLERLVARPPRVLFSVAAAEGRGDRLATHPALARLARRVTVAPFPTRLLSCGGPSIVPAMARLRAVRAEVAA